MCLYCSSCHRLVLFGCCPWQHLTVICSSVLDSIKMLGFYRDTCMLLEWPGLHRSKEMQELVRQRPKETPESR